MTVPLQLQPDEVDMIAYASEAQPVCSFYYDDSIDPDVPAERARAMVHRVNVHEQMLRALEAAESAINESADIMLCEDDLPVTALESYEIETACNALAGIRAVVQKAVKDGRSPAVSKRKGKRS
jgi:hypothetical protein